MCHDGTDSGLDQLLEIGMECADDDRDMLRDVWSEGDQTVRRFLTGERGSSNTSLKEGLSVLFCKRFCDDHFMAHPLVLTSSLCVLHQFVGEVTAFMNVRMEAGVIGGGQEDAEEFFRCTAIG